MQRFDDGSVEYTPFEALVVEIHECLTYEDDMSSSKAYELLRGLRIPHALRPSTPYLDDVLRDSEFRDHLIHER